MSKILTPLDKLVLSPLWLITLLPLRVMYLLSDMLYVVLYHIIGYRRKVVRENLVHAFPDQNTSEIIRTEKKFYHHLIDMFIESIYLINMSKKAVLKRYHVENPEVLHDLLSKGRDIMLNTSHFGNWEWAIHFKSLCPEYEFMGIYKPLTNKTFDRLFIYLRSKGGGIPVSMKQTLRAISASRKAGQPFMIYSVADQRPMPEDMHYWMDFLKRKAPVLTGWERIARKFNMAVVFADVSAPKRGFYRVKFQVLTEDAADTKLYSIADSYMKAVEKQVYRQPEYYLWSHRRWKFQPEDYNINLDSQ